MTTDEVRRLRERLAAVERVNTMSARVAIQDRDDALTLHSDAVRTSARDGWDEVVVATPYGYVIASSYPNLPEYRITVLRFISGGRIYSRVFRGKTYARRGLVMEARRFAREVVETVLAGDQSQMAPAGAEGG